MNKKVNCIYNDQGAWCTNKLIKRSLLGIGARICKVFEDENCEFQVKREKPILKVPPQKKSYCKQHYGDVEDNPDYLSNPLPVIRLMEQSLPEVWEEYLDLLLYMNNFAPDRDYPCTFGLNNALDLSNLIAFLLDNQKGWGWKECCHIDRGFKTMCEICNGTGKVKHPALLYAESLKEGK